MKIFISADLEGVNGVVAPEDIEEGERGYEQACVWMTEEVNAVIRGAFAGGATEVVVCDSHNVSANIRVDMLDERAQLLRGDTRANSMVHSIDESYDGLILTGYHAKFGTMNAILDHSYSPALIRNISISGQSVGEMGFNSLFAAEKGVPVIMATGDQALEAEAKAFCPDIETAVVKYAEGRFCARCLPRAESQKLLEETAKRAVENCKNKKPVSVPQKPVLELTFQQVNMADGAMRVPGLRRLDAMTVAIDGESIEQLMALRQVIFNSAAGFYNPKF